MNKLTHWAIFTSNKTDKQLLVNQLLQNKTAHIFTGSSKISGALFSALTIKQIMEEEDRHHTVEVATLANRQLRDLSGGEQKKALLAYLLLQNPGFLIADDPFDNLDIASRADLLLTLKAVSEHIPIIQLLNRISDQLPFIKNRLSVSDTNTIVVVKNFSPNTESTDAQANLIFASEIPPYTERNEMVPHPLIKFSGVTIKYEEHIIVKDINWQINAGEFWHLIGPNGSGKSTLLSLITGDNVKGYGQDIVLFGKRKGSGESVWEIKQLIGYFTAAISYLFSRNTSVLQMVISGFYDSVGLYTKPSERQIKLAEHWLELIGMLPQKDILFHLLSLGQQRLILIVRAMVKHPPLLILDEPTAGLDDVNAKIVVQLINKMAADTKMAILYVSHREEEGLKPIYRYTLVAGANGSTGEVMGKNG